MPSSKTTFDSYHHPDHLYFVTAAICGWKPLFTQPIYADIVLNSLRWLRKEDRMLLFAFVLMPSHLHAIVKPKGRAIGELLQEFGSYTEHTILTQLRQDGNEELLAFFQSQRRDVRHQHSIWQDIQAKNIFSRRFLIQKLEYIHNNPTNKEWHLVEDRADYRYSSACFYDRAIIPIIEVDDVRDWL